MPKGRSILTTYDDPTHFSRLFRYSDTKFFVALFVRQLAELWPLPTGVGSAAPAGDNLEIKGPCNNGNVVINNVCPGTVVTTVDNNLPFYLRILMNVHRLIRGRSVLEGGRTLVYAATVAGVESHGGFISCNEITPYVLAFFSCFPSSLCFFRIMSQFCRGFLIADLSAFSRLPSNIATAEGKAFAQQLWDETIEELTNVDSRVLEALKP